MQCVLPHYGHKSQPACYDLLGDKQRRQAVIRRLDPRVRRQDARGGRRQRQQVGAGPQDGNLPREACDMRARRSASRAGGVRARDVSPRPWAARSGEAGRARRVRTPGCFRDPRSAPRGAPAASTSGPRSACGARSGARGGARGASSGVPDGRRGASGAAAATGTSGEAVQKERQSFPRLTPESLGPALTHSGPLARGSPYPAHLMAKAVPQICLCAAGFPSRLAAQSVAT